MSPDVEKGLQVQATSGDSRAGSVDQTSQGEENLHNVKSPHVTDGPMKGSPGAASKSAFGRFNERLTSIKFFEARGIERVPLEERHEIKAANYLQMSLLWFSTNITANNMALGMMGPLTYDLGFVDSALCATFGALLGAAGVAYMGTFGPASGNRTMVCFVLPHCGLGGLLNAWNRSLRGTSWVTIPARLPVFSTSLSCWATA